MTKAREKAGAHDLTAVVDARRDAIARTRERAQILHPRPAGPQEGALHATADCTAPTYDLTAVVDAIRVAYAHVARERAQILHSQSAGPQEGMVPAREWYQAVTYDLTAAVDATSCALSSAQRAQVLHPRPAGPQEGVAVRAPDDLTAVVDAIRGASSPAGEHTEIDNGPRGLGMTRSGQKYPEHRRQDAIPICFHSFALPSDARDKWSRSHFYHSQLLIPARSLLTVNFFSVGRIKTKEVGVEAGRIQTLCQGWPCRNPRATLLSLKSPRLRFLIS